jgi:hypothetical protein
MLGCRHSKVLRVASKRLITNQPDLFLRLCQLCHQLLVEADVSAVLKDSCRHGDPLCVILADALARDGAQLDFLHAMRQ